MFAFSKSVLHGHVTPPSSKSITHRVLICAALSQGKCYIRDVVFSKDVEATLNVLTALGYQFEKEKDALWIFGTSWKSSFDAFHCLGSGSTLRFMIPIVLTKKASSLWLRDASLKRRPLDIYYDIFKKQGIEYEETEEALKIQGQLKSGVYYVPGHVSSQFISGLLFALPLLEGDSQIILTTPLASESYVDLTINILQEFGIKIKKEKNGYMILGSQSYQARDYQIEKDYSQAAYFLMMKANGHDLHVHGLSPASYQGDQKASLEALRQMGLQYRFVSDELCFDGVARHPVDFDGQDCPDFVCALVIALINMDNISKIHHVGRLNYKESRRLDAIVEYVNALGAKAWVQEDTLYLQGHRPLHGATLSTYHDHRMAMLLACLSLECEGDILVDDIACIDKSYPHFIQEYQRLGGKVTCLPYGKII